MQIAEKINLPNNVSVEIYGENHGEENGFCIEIIKKKLLSTYTVLCEHSTLLSRVEQREYDLFQNATGSEYVFFNLMKEGTNFPICFDNRIENGLPSAIEEHALLSFFETNDEASFSKEKMAQLRLILVRFFEIKNLLENMSRIFVKFYEEEYSVLIKSIYDQLEILSKSAEKGLRFINGKNFFMSDRTNRQIILRIGYHLSKNIRRLCSAFVDINLILLIGRIMEEGKLIVIFTGASHAYRLLLKVFQKKAEILIQPSNKLLPYLQLKPEGNIEKETEFLQKL